MQRLTLFKHPITVFSPYDTPLHQVVSQCQSVAEVENYISVVGKAITAEQAKIGDAENDYLPIELIADSDLPDAESKKLYDLLAPYTFPENIPPFKEPVNLEEVKKNFPPDFDIHLLEIATIVCNQVREKINIVPTHPHTKSNDSISWSKVCAKLHAVREETNNAVMRFLLDNKSVALAPLDYNKGNEIRFSIPTDLLNEYYDIVTRGFLQAGIANCEQLALIAMRIFYKDHPEINVGAYLVENGDHHFLMLNISFAQPLDFTKHTCLFDPWYGLISPPDLLKIKNYKRLALNYERNNCVTYFNKTQSIAPFFLNGTSTLALTQKSASFFIERHFTDPRDLLTYKIFVETNLLLALDRKFLHKNEIVNLGTRMNFLKKIFSHPHILQLLEQRKFTLQALAAIDENNISTVLDNLVRSQKKQNVQKNPAGMFNPKKRLLLSFENENPQQLAHRTSTL